MPRPVRRTLRPSSILYTSYACGAQRALLSVAVGAMNIHDIRDRQTSDTHHFIMPPGRGITKDNVCNVVVLNIMFKKNCGTFFAQYLVFVE